MVVSIGLLLAYATMYFTRNGAKKLVYCCVLRMVVESDLQLVRRGCDGYDFYRSACAVTSSLLLTLCVVLQQSCALLVHSGGGTKRRGIFLGTKNSTVSPTRPACLPACLSACLPACLLACRAEVGAHTNTGAALFCESGDRIVWSWS